MRHAAGQLADRFHLLRLAQHFLRSAALGDVKRFGHGADDRAVPIPHGTHAEIEIALADRQLEPHFGPDHFALHRGRECVAHDVAHAFGAAEPQRIPERLADHVGRRGADAVERRPVREQQFAVEGEQPLILVAGLEHRAQPGFVGFELRGSLRDPLFEDFVELPQIVFGLLRSGDVVGDADEPDMPAGRIPARLGLRSQPAPLAAGVAVAGLQHERLQRGFARERFLQDALQIVRMQHLAPVEDDRLLERHSEEVEIGLVGEGTRPVELRNPDRYRRAVGDQPEALFAFAQLFLRQHPVGDVDMGAEQS